MLDVFLCHAPADREIAGRIKARLDLNAEAKVWLEPCGRDTAQTVAVAWEGGTSSAAILLLLSPDAIPERLRREDWQPLLDHLEGHAAPPVGALLLDACPYPPLLDRRRFFRWSDDATPALRGIERWVIGLHPSTLSFLPARLPWFQADEHELEAMWTALVDDAGTFSLTGPPAIAQEFARVASGHFRDILWVGCGDRSQLSIAAEIDAQVHRDHRLLLVLDDVRGEPPVGVPDGGRTSVLIIRNPRVDGLPVCTEPPTDSQELALWEAMSVCRPRDIHLELAARIANMNEQQARVVAERLAARRCIDPLDAAGTRFRLAAAGPTSGQTLRRRHAEVLNEVFSKWSTDPARCRNLLPEIESALDWTLLSDWPLATRLANRAAVFLKAEARLREAVQIYTWLREAARERWDIEVFDNCSEELRWIQDEKGGVRPQPVSAEQMGFSF